ncbi:MAG: helix-turn-helix domain-containing protein [Burkholderiaceae bacterium]
MSIPTTLPSGAFKALDILSLLLDNFAHGLTPGEIAKACSLSPSTTTRYLQALEERGYAERISETGRIRASVRIGQRAVAILNSLDTSRRRIDETVARLNTTH